LPVAVQLGLVGLAQLEQFQDGPLIHWPVRVGVGVVVAPGLRRPASDVLWLGRPSDVTECRYNLAADGRLTTTLHALACLVCICSAWRR
jgi:hypothetical protein